MDNEQPTLIERLMDEADQCRNDGADDIAALLDDAVAEIEYLRSGASAYDSLLRANGPSWLQRVSGGSYSDAVADCKRAGWRTESSGGWPDTDRERREPSVRAGTDRTTSGSIGQP